LLFLAIAPTWKGCLKFRMEVDSLKLNHINKYSPIYSIVLITIGTVVLVITFTGGYNKPSWVIIGLLLFAVTRGIFNTVKYWNKPVELVLKEKTLAIKSLFKEEIEMGISELEKIEIKTNNDILITGSGKVIRGVNSFKNFELFIKELKKRNNQIELIGF